MPDYYRLVDDVALAATGHLTGRVIADAGDSTKSTVEGIRIVLWRGSQPVAETISGRDGRFAFSHVSGGVYEVVADSRVVRCSRHCRVWSNWAAPPHASPEVELRWNAGQGQVVRGQSPFPTATIGRVATITGVVAGAIAVPVVYNTKQDEWIPASP